MLNRQQVTNIIDIILTLILTYLLTEPKKSAKFTLLEM